MIFARWKLRCFTFCPFHVDACLLASALQSVQDFSLWFQAPADRKRPRRRQLLRRITRKSPRAPEPLSGSGMSRPPSGSFPSWQRSPRSWQHRGPLRDISRKSSAKRPARALKQLHKLKLLHHSFIIMQYWSMKETVSLELPQGMTT
jgi:hypothetical protein